MSVPVPAQAAGLRPALPWSERAYQFVLTGALGALGFFVQFSTAGTAIALAVLVALVAIAPARVLRLRPWREPVHAMGLVLLAYIAVRDLAGAGFTRQALGAINHYHELLMIPILWALFRVARRPNAFINGLIVGALFLALLHWAALLSPQVAGFMLSRRVSAGFTLAICAYLFFEHARLRRIPPGVGYAASAAVALTVLFASDGRTGHLLLLFLLGCAGLRAAPARLRWRVTAAVLLLGVLAGSLSPTVRERVHETLNREAAGKRGEAAGSSSTAIRVQMLHNGLDVAREHWLIGTGWAAYERAYADAAARRYPDPTKVYGSHTVNPHSEYLLQLGAGGVPAFILFLLWLFSPIGQMWRQRRIARQWAGAITAVTAAYAISCLFNSALLDFVEGHFYGALLAWLLVRRVED